MKKYYGGYEICKALGFPAIDYIKITNFLSLIGSPKEINDKGLNTYCLTEKQIKFLIEKLRELKGEIWK